MIFLYAIGILAVLLALRGVRPEAQRTRSAFENAFHAKIVVEDEHGQLMACRLASTRYLLGRQRQKCDLIFSHGTVSRLHGVLWYDGTAFCIRPYHSLWKTIRNKRHPEIWVNQEPVGAKGMVLRDGVLIELCQHNGPCHVRFHYYCG